MGLIKPDLLTTEPPSGGGYTDPGNPARDAGRMLDNWRGTVIDWPILMVAIGILYDKAWVSNDESRSWTFGDYVFVIVVAYLLKRYGVAARWGGA